MTMIFNCVACFPGVRFTKLDVFRGDLKSI